MYNKCKKVGNLPVDFGEKEAEKSIESLNKTINDSFSPTVILKKIIVNPQWLRYARKCNRYTQQEVSKALHRDIKTIEYWEQTGELYEEELEQVAKLYNVSVLYFLNNNTPPNYPIKRISKEYNLHVDVEIPVKRYWR